MEGRIGLWVDATKDDNTMRIAFSLLILISLIAANGAQAGVVTGTALRAPSGAIERFRFLSDPFASPIANTTLGVGAVDRTRVFAFDELQGVVLANEVSVDQGIISAGTRVSSHYVLFDPRFSTNVVGTVTFDRPIIGVLTSRSRLAATNSILGLQGISYGSVALTGLEGADRVSVSGNVLSFNFYASDPGDHVRVLTSAARVNQQGAVPEPISGLIWATGIGVGTFFTRRRRRS
jgi:hypothetical protein